MWQQVKALEDQMTENPDPAQLFAAAQNLITLLRSYPLLVTVGASEDGLTGPLIVSSKGEKIGMLSEFALSVNKMDPKVRVRAGFVPVANEALKQAILKYKDCLKALEVDIA